MVPASSRPQAATTTQKVVVLKVCPRKWTNVPVYPPPAISQTRVVGYTQSVSGQTCRRLLYGKCFPCPSAAHVGLSDCLSEATS